MSAGLLPDFAGRQLCTQVDPELFFPNAQTQEAQAARDVESLCGACPVRQDCFDFAMRTGVSGVWAATSTIQRRALRRSTGLSVGEQQRRHRTDFERVAALTRSGLMTAQIVEQTGLHSRKVTRLRQELRATQQAPQAQIA